MNVNLGIHDFDRCISAAQNTLMPQQRERYLTGLVEIQHRVLMAQDISDIYPDLLQLLGQVSGVQGVYLLEKNPDAPPNMILQAIWWQDPAISHPLFPQSEAWKSLAHYLKPLETGEKFILQRSELLPHEQGLLEDYHLQQLLLIPLWFEETLIGIIGFEQHQFVPILSEVEQGLLTIAITAIAQKLGQQRREIALRQAEENYRSIFENTVEGIFQVTQEGQYLSVNPAFAKMLGYNTPEDFMGRVSHLQALYVDLQQYANYRQQLQADEFLSEFEYRVYRADHNIIWVSENAHAVKNEWGELLYYEGTVVDITQRKQIQDQLEYYAFHDPLTGLVNRMSFLSQLAVALDGVKSGQQHFFTVLLIDLNRFQVINQSLGHLVGDQLLIELAYRLEMYVGSCGRVARLGGDEFAVLLDQVSDYEEVSELVDNIEESFSDPFWIQGHEIVVTGSIGIARSHRESTGELYENPEQLLHNAHAAMERAKRLGAYTPELFDSTLHPVLPNELQLEVALRKALDNQEFVTYFQPIVAIQERQLYGFEVLVRWQHPHQGIIPPNDFIPLAEATGLIIPLGEWVLYQACQQIQTWSEQGLIGFHTTISVNLAGQQFVVPDLVERIQEILQITGLEASRLRLEITEGVIMSNDMATYRLKQLKALGVGLGIDDFGTGYSSLSRLHVFPLDTLKIDRSFVCNMASQQEGEIVKSIINLGLGLGLNLVAEGIETPDQLEHLQQLGCHYGQGYWFAKPLSKSGVENWLLEYQIH